MIYQSSSVAVAPPRMSVPPKPSPPAPMPDAMPTRNSGTSCSASERIFLRSPAMSESWLLEQNTRVNSE